MLTLFIITSRRCKTVNSPYHLQSVYNELCQLAAARMAREAPGQTIDATDLVHEVWMRLERADIAWNDKTHFLRTAATAMRRLLVDRARAKRATKRARELQVTLGDPRSPIAEEKVIQLDEALRKLAETKPQHAELMELRYFGGLTIDETAAALNISPTKADRMIRYAKAWLRVQLDGGD